MTMSEQPLIPIDQATVVSLLAETRFAANGIVSRTLWRSPNARVVLFGFAAGQELSEHTSPHHALVQVLSGECEFRVQDQAHALKPGDLLSMPPHAPHAVKATREFSMLLTLVRT